MADSEKWQLWTSEHCFAYSMQLCYAVPSLSS